jgi:CRISPR-associated protein Cas2
MFVILYYDIAQGRCQKSLKICRKYLTWVQNSVFEGEISEADLEALVHELNNLIKPDKEDSVIIYTFRTKKYIERKVYGKDKKEEYKFL